MNLLILSPYNAPSHEYWWRGLRKMFAFAQTTVVILPPRYFSWRFRGNSLTFAFDERLHRPYDLVIATSMTDLSALKGMCPTLSKTPCILYFHENQFAYPDQSQHTHLVERQLTSIYAAITADHLVFNSNFNRQTFMQGATKLLNKLPDGVPIGIVETLVEKSKLIPVALNTMQGVITKDHTKKFSIVWNHRWEHDKGVEELEVLCRALIDNNFKITFHLIGQSFRNIPAAITRTLDLLRDAEMLGHATFIESHEQYIELLQKSDMVLSTARHEFQGIAILEAIQAGCVPVVPNDLAYQEFVEAKYRYENVDGAIAMIRAHIQARHNNDLSAPDMPANTEWKIVAEAWQGLVKEVTTNIEMG